METHLEHEYRRVPYTDPCAIKILVEQGVERKVVELKYLILYEQETASANNYSGAPGPGP